MDRPDDTKTVALAVWGQFIHHDLVHTPIRKTRKFYFVLMQLFGFFNDICDYDNMR